MKNTTLAINILFYVLLIFAYFSAINGCAVKKRLEKAYKIEYPPLPKNTSDTIYLPYHFVE